MTFQRAFPFGESVGSKVDQAAMDQLDVDHANAADKTTLNDNIAGIWTFNTTTGQIKITGGSTGIASLIAGGVKSNAAGGIQSAAAGSFVLAGGATDFPTFSPSRTRTVWIQAADVFTGLVSNFQYPQGTPPDHWNFTAGASAPAVQNGALLTQVGATAANPWSYYFPIVPLHNGATISSVAFWLQGVASGSGRNSAALPAIMPALAVLRTGTAAGNYLLSGNPIVVDSSATYAAYTAPHAITVNCNQNNVVDTTQFAYHAIIWDDGGINFGIGNLYFGMVVTYSSIADMRFP